MKDCTAVVLTNEFISDRYYKVRLKCDYIANNIKEGQFVLLKTFDGNDPLLRRPFSVYRFFPEEGEVEFAYLLKGRGTELMTRIKPGDEVQLLGPLGNYFEVNETSKGIAVLGRGVGIASVAVLAESAAKSGLYSLAVLSGRNKGSVIGQEFLREAGCEVLGLNDEDGTSDIENIKNILIEKIEQGLIQQIYSCGSNRMGRLVKELSLEYNLDSYISFEEHMACGIGVCKGCTCKTKDGYKTVCHDGPIFGVGEVDL